jgi:hypothetical protein
MAAKYSLQLADPAQVSEQVQQAAMPRCVAIVLARAQRITPRRTGKLVRSLYGMVDRGGRRGVVAAKSPHAHLVHEGVQAHSLKPKRKDRGSFLVIPTMLGPLVRRSAQHPGYGGLPFLTDAAEQSRGEIDRALREVV